MISALFQIRTYRITDRYMRIAINMQRYNVYFLSK